MDFTMEGLDDLNRVAVDIGRASAGIGKVGAQILRKTAADIEADAKAFAPVDTGNLRNSIGTTITGDGRFTSAEAEIGPTASYGHYVEFGTSRMAPQAFMGPAFDRHAGQFVDAARELGRRALEENL